MEVLIEKNYNCDIEKILSGNALFIRDFSKQFFDILSRGLLYPCKLSKEKILFLGINPSFRENHDKVYGFNCISFENEIIEVNDNERYKYYKIFNQVAKDIPWTHFDVFPFREKNQNNLTTFIENKELKKIMESFVLLAKQIIEESNPSLIVVSNAYLRRTFIGNVNDNINSEKLILFNTEFSDKLGTHFIQDGKLKNTPIFFTSMLSGQRALDTGSRERLEWHIAKVYEKKIINFS
jgi:hypothetical protein